jgi:hypothetical protein
MPHPIKFSEWLVILPPTSREKDTLKMEATGFSEIL